MKSAVDPSVDPMNCAQLPRGGSKSWSEYELWRMYSRRVWTPATIITELRHCGCPHKCKCPAGEPGISSVARFLSSCCMDHPPKRTDLTRNAFIRLQIRIRRCVVRMSIWLLIFVTIQILQKHLHNFDAAAHAHQNFISTPLITTSPEMVSLIRHPIPHAFAYEPHAGYKCSRMYSISNALLTSRQT